MANDPIFKINSNDFERVLSKLVLSTQSKSPNASLDYFLFDFQDNNLQITSTDGNNYMTAAVDITGNVVKKLLASKLIFDVIKSLKDVLLTFTVREEKLDLKFDGGSYSFQVLPPDDIHSLPKLEVMQEVVMEGNVLKRAFETTIFAASEDQIRPAMNGLLLEFKDNALHFVATDGHRLVKYTNRHKEYDIQDQFVIPAKAITLLLKILPDDNVTIKYASNWAVFETSDNIKYFARLVGEKFPQYNNVIPLENDKLLVVDRTKLLSSVRRMLILTSNNSGKQIRIDLKDNTLSISTEDIDRGAKAGEVLECEYTASELALGFNASYLQEVLTHMSDEKVQMFFNTPTKAIIVKPFDKKENEELLLLLMPVRLNN